MLRLLVVAVLASYALAVCPCNNYIKSATASSTRGSGWEVDNMYGAPKYTSSVCSDTANISWAPAVKDVEENVTLKFTTAVKAEQLSIWLNNGANVNFTVLFNGTEIGSHVSTNNCNLCGKYQIPLQTAYAIDEVTIIIYQSCGFFEISGASLDASTCCVNTTTTTTSSTTGTTSTSSTTGTTSTTSSSTTGAVSTTTTSTTGSAPSPSAPAASPSPSAASGCATPDAVCTRDCIVLKPSKVPNPTKVPKPSKNPNPTKMVAPEYYTIQATFPCSAVPAYDCCAFYDALPDASSSKWLLCGPDSAEGRKPSYDEKKGDCTIFMYAQAGTNGIDDAAFKAAQDSVKMTLCGNTTASACDITAKSGQSLSTIYKGSASAIAVSALLLSCVLAMLL